jgi:cation transport ATPase
MNEERARQRAHELTQKALAEAEKETFKIDRSLQGKHIVTKSEKAARKKEEKRIEKEMRRSSDKPAFLVSLAVIFEKLLHIVVTLYTMAIVVNILFFWQIYKAVSAGGWQAVFHSKYTLFVLAYFALLFILKKVYFALYTYANE